MVKDIKITGRIQKTTLTNSELINKISLIVKKAITNDASDNAMNKENIIFLLYL